MLIERPIIFRKRRARIKSPDPVPSVAAITVTAVIANGLELTWTFSAPVTLTGGNVPELENDIDGTGMWQSPTSCAQGAANSIVATYPDAPQEATPWRIQTAPSNVAQSASVTVPQSGTIG